MAFSPDDVHVLLVDHDTAYHAYVIDMLKTFSYKGVTRVTLASTAMSMLSKGKVKVDVVIANINSPDMCSFKLLQFAAQLDLLFILMLEEEEVDVMRRAMGEGAFLCLQKPIPMETIKYLWQHVLRHKMHKFKQVSRDVMPAYNLLGQNVDASYTFDLNIGGYVHETIDHYRSKRKTSGRQGIYEKDDESSMHGDGSCTFRRKVWTEWTQELHDKFVEAIILLGEGRCYPKEILDLMNVPGLTRMQVASHLQKCRSGTWIPPHERKSKGVNPTPPHHDHIPTQDEPRAPRAKIRRFGSMPPLLIYPQQTTSTLHDKSLGLDEEEHNGNPSSSVGDNNSEGSSNDEYGPQIVQYENQLHYSSEVLDIGAMNNMWNLGVNLGIIDEAFMSVPQAHHMFNGSDHIQAPNPFRQEPGGVNYTGNLQAPDLQQLCYTNIQHDQQVSTLPDSSSGGQAWSQETSKSAGYDDDEEEDEQNQS